MKKSIVLTCLVLVLAPARAHAAEGAVPRAELQERSESGAYISRGMSRAAVTEELGAPAASVGPDVWVYWDFRAKGRPGGERWDTLLVVFEQGRVSRIRLTEQAPVVALLKKLGEGRWRGAVGSQ